MTNTNLQQVLESHFSETLPDYSQLLKKMVDINSFTANVEGVNALIPLGFEAELIQSTEPGIGKHVVLTKLGTGCQTSGLIL